MIIIPERTKKQFIQGNRGHLLGNILSTFGIDFQDNLGAVRLGQKMKIVTKTGDSNAANLGVPTSFCSFSTKMVCLAGTRAFISNKLSPDMVFAEDTSTNARTDWSSDTDDLLNFNGVLVGLNGTQGKLYSLDSPTTGTWTTRSTVGSNSGGQLLYFQRTNRLYIMNGSVINSVDTSWSVSTAGNPYYLALTGNDDGGSGHCFAAGRTSIWIGMKRGIGAGVSDNSGDKLECSIHEWDGTSNQTVEYKIPAHGVMSIVIKDDIPILLDSEGVLRRYDGQGFVEIGRLPLKRNENLTINNSPAWTQNFIHPKGMVVSKDNTVLALINNKPLYTPTTRLYENLPSGIWEFDLKGSASMRHPLTTTPVSSTSITDYGQNRISLIGSLAILKYSSGSAYGIYSLVAGAEYYTDASSTKDAIFIDAPSPTTLVTYPEGQKSGYFTTPWIFAGTGLQVPSIKDNWEKGIVRYRQFLDSGDKIVVKYRIREIDPTEISITWVSTTSFTTTTDLTALVGYEIEVLQGTGSGKCSHIVSATNNAGTYTVVVDETYTGVTSGTAKARYQNWTKLLSVSDQASESKKVSIGKASERIQFKVWMQFTGNDELYELIISNKDFEPIN